jgi:hypothetical protein
MNDERLQQGVEQVLADLGGAFRIGLVRIGTALGFGVMEWLARTARTRVE